MDFASIVFYVLAALVVFSSVMVISARNPVHAVLFLIFAFFNAAGLFVLLGAEYIAMTLVIVYVGAVAVLFLFVVMMLNINFAELRQGFLRYLPIGIGVALVLFVELYFVIEASSNFVPSVSITAQYPTPTLEVASNTNAIGLLLYTDFALMFQLAGLILLVAMIGAIVLTLRHRPVRRQKVGQQVSRQPKDTLRIIKVKPGEGV
ncbi:MAG: NADH-quinone oxidoreductase subunit J [Alphaproteobacteria bacterium]|nr:NADH-quinone oxidoreductase subunit J [Alphaproteobacteria bacterium]